MIKFKKDWYNYPDWLNNSNTYIDTKTNFDPNTLKIKPNSILLTNKIQNIVVLRKEKCYNEIDTKRN